MKLTNLFLVSFLLLAAPCDYYKKSGLRGVSGDHVPNCSERKKDNFEVVENYISKSYCKDTYPDTNHQGNVGHTPVKVRCKPIEEQRCAEKNRIKLQEEGLCRKEIETIKEAAAKWESSMAEKKKNLEERGCGSAEKSVKVDFPKSEVKCSPPGKKGNTLCAECEQCELQIKANGEGVLLRCRECREVPTSEVRFPAGNNRRIIKLP